MASVVLELQNLAIRFDIRLNMPCCPSCAKGFKDAASVAMHMSQPTSRCNNWVNDFVHLQEELELPSTSSPRNPIFSTPHSQASDVPAARAFHDGFDGMDLDNSEVYRPVSVLNALTEDHFPGAAQTFGNGQMLLDRFSTDKFCHDRDRTYPYTPYPDLSTPIPSHLNHSQAPNTKPEPSDPLASQQRTPKHSDSLASSQRIPDPTHPRPLLFLTSSRFPTNTLIPDPTPFDLHSFASNLFLTFHRSCDCGWAKPNRVPPSLDAS